MLELPVKFLLYPPCLRRKRRAASCPLWAALKNGVMPYTLVRLCLAPAFSSMSQISTLFLQTASCSAVQPRMQCVFTAAPWFNRAATMATLLRSQAARKVQIVLQTTESSGVSHCCYLCRAESLCHGLICQGLLHFPAAPGGIAPAPDPQRPSARSHHAPFSY